MVSNVDIPARGDSCLVKSIPYRAYVIHEKALFGLIRYVYIKGKPRLSVMEKTKVRPIGITIIVILEAVVSALLVFSGLVLVVLGPILGITLPEVIQRPLPGIVAAAFTVIFGIFILILGAAGCFIAWGLWTGQGWAWTVALVFMAVNIVINLFSFDIVGLIINALIAFYLWQPHVKAFYGKQAVELPYQVTVSKTQPPQPPQQPQPGTVIYCSKCGVANALDSRFCRNCGAEIKA